MKITARETVDPRHGPTLEVTYHIRLRQLGTQSGGAFEKMMEQANRDLVRRCLGWRKAKQ